MLSPNARELFLLKIENTMNARNHIRIQQEMNLDFATLLILLIFVVFMITTSNNQKNYNIIAKHVNKTNCEITIDYKFNEFIIIYFSDHECSINIKDLSNMVNEKDYLL